MDLVQDNIGLFQLGVSIIGVFVGAFISIVVYRASREAADIGNGIRDAQKDISAAIRIDGLAEKAATVKSRDHLDEILRESQHIGSEVQRRRVMREYWSNPSVSVSDRLLRADKEGVEITAELLDEKLDGSRSSSAISELDLFVQYAEQNGVEVDWPIASWVVREANSWRADRIRGLIKRVRRPEFYSSLLDGCGSIGISLQMRAEVLSAVCLEYLGEIGFEKHSQSDATNEVSERCWPLSDELLQGLTDLTHHGDLNGLAHESKHEYSLFPAEICAVVVGAAGAASCVNSHRTTRILESIQRFGLTAQDDFGRYQNAWDFGLKKFRQYQPEQLNRYPIDPQ